MDRKIVVQVAGALLRWSTLGRMGTRTVGKDVRKIVEGIETTADARAGAIARAKREVLEEMGAYLERRGVVGADESGREDAVAVSSTLMDTSVVRDKVFRSAQGEGVRIVVKGRVNTIGLQKRVRRLLGDSMQMERLRATQRHNSQLLEEYGNLEERNRRIAELGRPSEQGELRKAFDDTTRKLTAQEHLDKAQALWDGLEYRDHKMAIDYINEAIKLVPDYPLYHFYRGNANYYWEQYQPALRDFGQAIALNGQYAEALNNRGIVHYRMGDYPPAIADYEQAVLHKPDYADALNNHGNACYKQRNFEQALDYYGRALALDPGNALYYNNRAISHDGLGQSDRALEDYARAIELDPALATAYFNRGRSHAHRGDHREAIADFTRAIGMDRRHAEAYFERGNAYYTSGQKGVARRDWRKAAKLGHKEARHLKDRK